MASSLRIGAASAALIAVLVTAGCAASGSPDSSGSEGGSIKIGLGQPFNTFDFDSLTSVADYQFAKEVIEPLVVPNDAGDDLRPAFAESFSYDETGTVLTFEIAKDKTFSDGTPATSADVVFSYNVWKDGGAGPLLSVVTSVEAPTPQQVVVTLAQPSSSLLSVLSWASEGVVKEDFGGLTREEYFQDPIGTGPYTVDSWTPGGTVVLTKNDTYVGEVEPTLDTVTLELIDDPNQRTLQFTSGDLDIVEAVTPEMVSQFDADVLSSSPAAGNTSIYFNTASGPFADANLRKAVSLAIDREALVESVYAGQGEAATSMLPPNLPGSVSCVPCDYPTRDLDAAKAALAASGYNGETLTLGVNSTTGRNILAAQAIQPMLAEAGITIAIDPADQSTMVDNAIAGTYEFSIHDYYATSPTLNDPLSFDYQTDGFWTHIDGAQFLASYNAVDLARTPEEMEAAALEFEEWSYDTMWATPVASVNSVFAVKPRVQGMVVNPISLYSLSNITVTN
ncbi:MAG TPA: ABC transporter substrate-binding protein [Microbacterium sp.]|uniref:ABC transporter substrate-binding protein n=1 Tax=Microbacterium sp. TaxID=51671 RepID=UPI002C64C3DF|nr:ABC transporter substrate-binding protein [Microbacterium sp.]HWI32292.1 ABC transporter substrate-binding protein [Microbacterium sp.]